MQKGKEVVATVTYNPRSNKSELYVSNDIVATGDAPTSGAFYETTVGGFVIGNHANVPRTISADISEIIVYDRALKASEIKDIQSYLAKKYNIN